MAENPPVPDPTILTTEQLLRMETQIKEWVTAELDGHEALDGERFKGVEKQFQLVESRRVEQKADTEKAVQAALSAAKEALGEQTAASEKSINKSETATTEAIKQQGNTLSTSIKGTDDKVTSLASRMDRVEAAKLGGSEQKAETSLNYNLVLGGIYLLIAIVGLYLATKKH